MTDFVKRVSKKLLKLSDEQIEQLFDAVTEENQILDSIFESLSTGLLICDEEFRLIYANKASERLFHFSSGFRFNEQKNSDLHVWELIHDKDVSDFLYACFLNQNCNICREFTLGISGESTRFIEVTLSPLVKKGKLEGSIISVIDITEKRHQETLLRRMEGLAGLTNLAASVAHEIKNPLGSISIHIQLIQKAVEKARKSDGKLPDEKFMEKYLSVVNEEIARLNGIVVDFLFAVRPVNPEFQLLNPNELLNQYIDFCRPELNENDIEVQFELMDNPPNLLLDSNLFRQVILNLVQNAQSAMPNGGTLWISSNVKNDSFILCISDNGHGMDEKTAARIFEPYYTTKVNGTGLGLTMAYKIIKEFAGDITVQSELGEGTLFRISLPVPQRERHLLEYNIS